MKRLVYIIVSFGIILSLSEIDIIAQSTAQTSVSGHITAEVISVFSANENSQMNFGRFSPGPQGGQIIVSPENSVYVLGSIFTGTGIHNAASFYLTGDNDAAYSITLPKTPVILTNTLSDKKMMVADWISVPSPVTGAIKLKDGAQYVYVGATLKVGTLNDNPVGIYTGSYAITFDFD
jgi:hypothetical protein